MLSHICVFTCNVEQEVSESVSALLRVSYFGVILQPKELALWLLNSYDSTLQHAVTGGQYVQHVAQRAVSDAALCQQPE